MGRAEILVAGVTALAAAGWGLFCISGNPDSAQAGPVDLCPTAREAVSENSEPVDAIPRTFFGIHVAFPGLIAYLHAAPAPAPAVPFGALGKGAFASWADAEPEKGVFNWNVLDAYVQFAERQGVEFYYSEIGIPEWAVADKRTCFARAPQVPLKCTGMVARLQDYEDYVRALARRYKGRIKIYELWNEPNNPQFFSGSLGDFVTLTTREAAILREVDPAAMIVSPAVPPRRYWKFLDDYWAGGGVKAINAVGFHCYNAESVVPEEVVSATVEQMRRVMKKHSISAKPLWNTEGSWGNEQENGFTNPEQQAAFVARYYLLLWSAGVTRSYWYAWDGGAWGPLWDRNAGMLPAGVAYGQVYKWMVGATMNSPCRRIGESTWVCGFTRPGGYRALAIWNTSGDTIYRAEAKYTQYRDLSGQVSKVTGPVRIGGKPILLETGPPEFAYPDRQLHPR